MATLRNLSASALSVPALDGRSVDPGEAVETTNDVAAGFLGQPETWQVDLDDDPRTADQLRAELDGRGLPTDGRKSELALRLLKDDRNPAGPVRPAEPNEPGEPPVVEETADPSTTEQGE